jgi:hypothetical protein
MRGEFAMSKVTALQILSRMFIRQYGGVTPIVFAEDNNTKVIDKLLSGAQAAASEIAYLANMENPPQLGGVKDFQRCSLVHFRGTYPGTQDTVVKRVVHMPQTYTDVKEFIPINDQCINIRTKIADKFGFLLVDCDEMVGVEYETPSGHLFKEAFENNDLGFCLNNAELSCSYSGLDHFATPIAISDLDITRTKSAIEKSFGKLWATGKALSTLQKTRIDSELLLLEAHLKVAPPERTASGAVIHRSFIENGSTESTAHIRPATEGWRCYPTSQDAWYFGVWINARTYETLCYAEQDVTHVQCQTEEQFFAQLKDMAMFHGQNLTPSGYGYGYSQVSVMFDCLTLANGECKTVVFHETGEVDQDKPSNSKAAFMTDITLQTLNALADSDKASQEYIELSRFDEFDVNLLDPRSFQGEVTAKVKNTDGQTWTLLVTVGETTYQTDFTFEALATA